MAYGPWNVLHKLLFYHNESLFSMNIHTMSMCVIVENTCLWKEIFSESVADQNIYMNISNQTVH